LAVWNPQGQQEQVWDLYLRGWPYSRIGRELGLHRDTVSGIVEQCYAEVAGERKRKLSRKLDAAVERLRRVQRQAWADHDADDAREVRVLLEGAPGVRYQSQRAAYLKVIVDAEREISRLEGLSGADASEMGGSVVLRIERLGMMAHGVTVEQVGGSAGDAEAESCSGGQLAGGTVDAGAGSSAAGASAPGATDAEAGHVKRGAVGGRVSGRGKPRAPRGA
jgi:hypothetical protein